MESPRTSRGSALLLLILPALGGCPSFDFRSPVDSYGAALERSEGRRAILWVADVEGRRFRRIVEEDGVASRQEPVEVSVEQALADLANTEPGLDGVTILLPDPPTAGQKAAADVIAADLRERNPGASLHLVVAAGPWTEVRTYDALREAAKSCSKDDGIPHWWASWAAQGIWATMPHFIVVPAIGSEDRFLVAGDLHDDGWLPLLFHAPSPEAIPVSTLTTAEVVSRAADVLLSIPGDTPFEKRPESRVFYRPWLWVHVPADAPLALRERVAALVARLTAPDFRRLVVAVECVGRSYLRMQTVEDLRDHIRLGGEESVPVGEGVGGGLSPAQHPFGSEGPKLTGSFYDHP